MELNIKLRQNAPYDEVVDTVADVLQAGVLIENELQDGFQAKDIFAAMQIQPVVQEIINDAPIFLEQFMALKGGTAKKAVLEASQRVGEKGVIVTWITSGLYALASSYSYAMNGKKQVEMWQSLIKGGNIMPVS